MIVIELTNTSAYPVFVGSANKKGGGTIPSFESTPVSTVCDCDFACDYLEYVFAKVGGLDYENDKSSFLFRRLVAVDTVDIKLFKDDEFLADLNDDTYGEFFDGFASGSDEQQLYKGYRVDWENVMNVNGPGMYQIKADLDITGVVETFESQQFFLLNYTDTDANETARIETFQNGNIMSSVFDHTGLNWFQSFRLNGAFWDKQPALNIDRYLSSEYVLKQTQDKIVNTYTFESKLISNSILNQITQDNILANELFLTDYSIFNDDRYIKTAVAPIEIETVKNHRLNNKKNFLIKFVDRVDNIIKRNN